MGLTMANTPTKNAPTDASSASSVPTTPTAAEKAAAATSTVSTDAAGRPAVGLTPTSLTAGTNVPPVDPSATTEGTKALADAQRAQDERQDDRDQADRVPPGASLAQALGALARSAKVGGHQLLAHVANLDEAPKEVREACEKIAFATNTGLAPRATDGLKGLTNEQMSALVTEVLEGQMTQEQVTGLLRSRFPEPNRQPITYLG